MCEECQPLIDDPEGVPDEVILYRRVRWDQIGGRDRCPKGETAKLSNNAFSDYPAAKAHEYGLRGPCMSVGISTVLAQRELQPAIMLEGLTDDFGLAAVRAIDLRNLKRKNGESCPQGIMAMPTSSEPWHGVVFGNTGVQRGKPEKQAIADKAYWLIPLIND